ncbi:hypothetical protein RRG08_062593 [Elysia crispata]|uniref:Uncharacterized protein n=1 Tax=Elysia crispata TaxID=231223 RepID=A0AAE0YZN4_9GAST|nr:hypothetical protein RRG08_062593 [Elysia crispata]
MFYDLWYSEMLLVSCSVDECPLVRVSQGQEVREIVGSSLWFLGFLYSHVKGGSICAPPQATCFRFSLNCVLSCPQDLDLSGISLEATCSRVSLVYCLHSKPVNSNPRNIMELWVILEYVEDNGKEDNLIICQGLPMLIYP